MKRLAIIALCLLSTALSPVVSAQTLNQVPGTKISQLPAAASLSGTESIPADQNGNTVQTTPAAIAAYIAPVTSVAFTVPSWLTVTGTSTGAVSYSISATAAQTENEFIATPNGSAGAVGLRAIASADVPPISLTSTANGGVTGTLPVTQGGNGLTTATLGDLRYGSGTNTLAILAGNTTTTKKFLTQTGTGSVSAAPAYAVIALGDLPAGTVTQTTGLISAGTTFTLGTGTGACTTNSTATGGNTAGSFVCTNTAGASTQVINLPTATHGWTCFAQDETSGVDWATSAHTASSATVKGTIATTSDVVSFGCIGY